MMGGERKKGQMLVMLKVKTMLRREGEREGRWGLKEEGGERRREDCFFNETARHLPSCYMKLHSPVQWL